MLLTPPVIEIDEGSVVRCLLAVGSTLEGRRKRRMMLGQAGQARNLKPIKYKMMVGTDRTLINLFCWAVIGFKQPGR